MPLSESHVVFIHLLDANGNLVAQIDELLEELKTELDNAVKGSEEQIINAMINNYQTKLAILERVLQRIQSIQQDSLKLNTNESINI